MDDRYRDNGVESRIRRAYDKETLSLGQRRQHLNRLADARSKNGTSALRPGRMELVVVATMLVVVLAVVTVWQGLPSSDSGQPATQPTESTEALAPESVVSIDEIRTLATEPAPGTGFTYTVVFTSDVRTDLGLTTNWEAEIWDRTLDDGTRQQRVIIRSPISEIIAEYIRNGDVWFWSNRGWMERGSMAEQIYPPAEVTLALSAPKTIVDLLDDGELPLERDSMPSQIVIEYGEELRAEVEWVANAFELDPFQYVAELHIDSALISGDDNYIESFEHLLAGKGDQRTSLGRFAYYSEPQTDSATFLGSTFAIPDGELQRFDLGETTALPFGLELYEQNPVTPEGGDRLLFASETAQVEMFVSPSLGGIDVNLWQAQTEETYPDTSMSASAMGSSDDPDFVLEVAWRERVDDGSVVTAIWDDGQYLYRVFAFPLNWTSDELLQLAEALSAP